MRTLFASRSCGVLTAALLLGASNVVAQAPTVDKVDPPNWWGQHSINPVRLLVHGANLSGARFECPRLSCSRVTISANGTYAFVDV
ncbi:MAG: cyclomaltodextrinase N-terminal domain-containing protein, partial [Gemmatimonadaceae bacterium]|nr:cyclomaltodextrinase N-terminal domain-containing protein [Gemmatimonadaceae bacterium]